MKSSDGHYRNGMQYEVQPYSNRHTQNQTKLEHSDLPKMELV